MYAPFNGLFTNDWLNFVMSNYSGIFALIPVILTALLKLVAIFDPNVPSDKINDWIQGTFYSKDAKVPKRNPDNENWPPAADGSRQERETTEAEG